MVIIMKTKKRKKMKKHIKIILSLLLVIIVGYISITVLKHFDNQEMLIPLPVQPNKKEEKDNITKELEKLSYNDNEITLIKQYITEENINYIIN